GGEHHNVTELRMCLHARWREQVREPRLQNQDSKGRKDDNAHADYRKRGAANERLVHIAMEDWTACGSPHPNAPCRDQDNAQSLRPRLHVVTGIFQDCPQLSVQVRSITILSFGVRCWRARYRKFAFGRISKSRSANKPRDGAARTWSRIS